MLLVKMFANYSELKLRGGSEALTCLEAFAAIGCCGMCLDALLMAFLQICLQEMMSLQSPKWHENPQKTLKTFENI